MDFDFSIIKGWISWPINFFKEKVLKNLSEQEKKVALYTIGIFAYLTALFGLHSLWKKSTKTFSAKPIVKLNRQESVKSVLKEIEKVNKLTSISERVKTPKANPPQTNLRFSLSETKPVTETKPVLVRMPSHKSIKVLKEVPLTPRFEKPPTPKFENPIIKRGSLFISFVGERDKKILKNGKLFINKEMWKITGEFSLEESGLSGKGTIQFPDGSIFVGQCNKSQLISGRLTCAESKGLAINQIELKKSFEISLKGEFVLNDFLLTGKGTIEGNNPWFTYTGSLEYGIFNGNGSFKCMDFEEEGVYTKGFLEGKKCIKHWLDSTKIVSLEGKWETGKFIGKLTLPHGGAYEGRFDDIPEDGYGASILNNQLRLGTFANGKFVEGVHVDFKRSQVVSDGQFVDGVLVKGKQTIGEANLEGEWLKEGVFKGKVTFSNGKSFEGVFEQLPHREGQSIEGHMLKMGTFNRGKLVKGTHINFYEPNTISEGDFGDGNFLEKGTKTVGQVVLKGEWGSRGEFNGTVLMPNGVVYSGEFNPNQKDGKGQSVEEDQLRIGTFQDGIMVEGMLIAFNDPNTVYEGQFKHEFIKGKVTRGNETWHLELLEWRLVGKHIAPDIEEMGIFENLHLIEGIKVENNGEGNILTYMGYFSEKGEIIYGSTFYSPQGIQILGSLDDEKWKTIYYKNLQNAWFGTLKNNVPTEGVLRDKEGGISVGRFDQGINYGLIYNPNGGYEVIGGDSPGKVNKLNPRMVEEGLFNQDSLRYGEINCEEEKDKWTGVFKDGFIIAGTYNNVIEGTFESGIIRTGKMVLVDGTKWEGAFELEKKRFIGTVTYVNETIETGIFFQKSEGSSPILQMGIRKQPSGDFEKGFFDREGKIKKVCQIEGFEIK